MKWQLRFNQLQIQRTHLTLIYPEKQNVLSVKFMIIKKSSCPVMNCSQTFKNQEKVKLMKKEKKPKASRKLGRLQAWRKLVQDLSAFLQGRHPYSEWSFIRMKRFLMRLSDGVMVRTRSIQRQERDVTIEMLNKVVGVPWDPTWVLRARADGGHHDGEHVSADQISCEVGLPVTREQTPRSMSITSDLIRLDARNVVLLLEDIPSIRRCRTHVLAGNASKDLSEMTHCHVIAWVVLRKDAPPGWNSQVSRQEKVLQATRKLLQKDQTQTKKWWEPLKHKETSCIVTRVQKHGIHESSIHG